MLHTNERWVNAVFRQLANGNRGTAISCGKREYHRELMDDIAAYRTELVNGAHPDYREEFVAAIRDKLEWAKHYRKLALKLP